MAEQPAETTAVSKVLGDTAEDRACCRSVRVPAISLSLRMCVMPECLSRGRISLYAQWPRCCSQENPRHCL